MCNFSVSGHPYSINPAELNDAAYSFQRSIKPSKVNKLVKSMQRDGWWGDSIIIVDQHGTIISGHHRRIAALQAGLDKVLVVQYNFEALRDAAVFYNDQAKWNPSQTVVERYKSLVAQDNSFAKFLLELNKDVNSPLYDKILLIEPSDDIFSLPDNTGNKRRLTIPQVIFMFGRLFGLGREPKEETLTKFADTYNKTYVSKVVKEFLYFLENAYGSITDNGKHPVYADRGFKAYVEFYAVLRDRVLQKPSGGINKRKYNQAIKRMKTFDFSNWNDNIYRRITIPGARLALIEHYNTGAQADEV